MRYPIPFAVVAGLTMAPVPAAARVTASSESGFVSHNEIVVPVAPAAAWDGLLKPGDWWSGEHTYSGSAANMTIEPTAGGCFCETIPGASGVAAGQIEHMRVIYVMPGATLRMTGGLGPLQSEAVTGVLTMTIEPTGEGTKIAWDMVVGGYMRTPMPEIAPLVDQVIGEQLSRLAAKLGSL